MGNRICSVEGCGRKHEAKGYCNMHYLRQWWAGAIGEAQPRKAPRMGACLVADCGSEDYCKGYCRKHYERWRRHGDPNALGRSGRPPGPAPELYVDVPTYAGMHQRIKKLRGKASEQCCVQCGSEASEWAYDHNDPSPVVHEGRTYSLDPGHYQSMCVPCHRQFDAA
jgi:hypothetical protein